MIDSQLFFVALPLVLIVVSTFISMVFLPRDKRTSRLQMLIGFITVYSMAGYALGLVAMGLVSTAYGAIPGNASSGGVFNGQYYFYQEHGVKRGTYTPVTKETWDRAWFLEQCTLHLLYISAVAFAVSLLILVATKRFFLIDSDTETRYQQKFTPP